METCFEYLSENPWGTFSTDEAKWVRKIEGWQKEYPGEVVITARNKDGSIVAHLPKKWFKVAPPIKRTYTDEQRAEMAARLAKARTAKS